MLFDTHSHIQFKIFDENRDKIIERAKDAGVERIIAIGTDLESSKKAVAISERYPVVFASIGIHPHHLFEDKEYFEDLKEIEKLVQNPKVVAIGETGMDKYVYKKTKYSDYQITDVFIKLQEEIFTKQIQLAIKHKKSLIIHNIAAVEELLQILQENWDECLKGRTVFHCCEPDERLLDFAKRRNIFIGIDGDITYYKEKQEFIKKVPLELLVLETDSPFLIPDPLYSQGIKTNEPANLSLIADEAAKILGVSIEEVQQKTFENSKRLFNI